MACIVFTDNNLKRMIKYIYCLCLLACSMGLPLLAKDAAVGDLTPSSTGKGTKGGTSSCSTSPTTAEEKAPNAKKQETTVLISDRSRAEISAATLAAKPQPAKPTLVATAVTVSRPDKKTAEPARKLTSTTTAASKSSSAKTESLSELAAGIERRLARVTAYWASEGDYYTRHGISATGVRLHDGHCAVDPTIIPYGSVVEIAGVGKFLAVDTGSAVISRTAAREAGHTAAERGAIVVDLYFEDRSDGERFAAKAAKFVSISWSTPRSMASEAKVAGGLFAEEEWTKIQGKQL
jgi:3D (Asp-Asp-Asp) domain-containing protein